MVSIVPYDQEKALVVAFSVIVKTDCETDGSFYSTKADIERGCCRCLLAAGISTTLVPSIKMLFVPGI